MTLHRNRRPSGATLVVPLLDAAVAQEAQHLLHLRIIRYCGRRNQGLDLPLRLPQLPLLVRLPLLLPLPIRLPLLMLLRLPLPVRLLLLPLLLFLLLLLRLLRLPLLLILLLLLRLM